MLVFSCFGNVVNGLKQLKELTYCQKTKWMHVTRDNSTCLQCKRVFRNRLTLDGWRLKLQGKVVDKNAEERKMNVLYPMRAPSEKKNLQALKNSQVVSLCFVGIV